MRGVVVAVAMLAAVTVGRAAEPIAIVVIVDGLGANAATPARLPRLAARAAAPGSTWTTARGVLPARTNPNHASMLTGQWPDGHGIVGNRYWDADAGERVPADDPRLLDAETIFDVLAAERPAVTIDVFFGKAKLRRLFAGTWRSEAEHRVLWNPPGEYASDGPTVRAAKRAVGDEPTAALLVMAIADVDRASHGDGPGSTAARAAVEEADRLLDGFLATVRDRGLWERTVVIVTSDHGFAEVPDGGVIELPAGIRDGVAWVDEGRVAFGHPVEAGAGDPPAAVLGLPGVAGVRRDLSAMGLAHPRAGAFMLLAALGHAFTLDAGSYRMRGDHGGEAERAVPFVVVGGHPSLRALPPDVHPTLPDVAPTVAEILGVRAPRSRRREARRGGRPLPLWALPAPAP